MLKSEKDTNTTVGFHGGADEAEHVRKTQSSNFDDQNCLVRLLLMFNPYALLFYFAFVMNVICSPISTLMRIVKKTIFDTSPS